MMKEQNNLGHNNDYDLPDGYVPEKRSKAPLIISIVLAALVVLAAAGFFAYALFFSENAVIKRAEETTAPSSASETADETESTTVGITANQIAELAVMPDITGLKEADAYSKLNSAGIKFSVKREYSETVALNKVIKQTPSAGEQISRAKEAVIYISRGKEDEVIPFTTSPAKSKNKTESSGTEESKTSKTEQSKAEDGEYILPDSSSRNLSESDLKGLSREELNLALNEIYARNGRKFSSAEIREYFESKSWYHGTISPADFDESTLNSYEKYNVGFIYNYQAEHGYR